MPHRRSFVRTFLFYGILFLTVIFAAGNNTQAATLTVTSNGDQTINAAGCSDGCTLREAIAEASAGDTINFDASLAGKTIILNGTELLVNKSLTIINSHLPMIAISGNYKSRVFNITGSNVELNGLIVMNGKVTNASQGGGGILTFFSSSTTIKNCLVTGNIVDAFIAEGGGISGGGTITNSTISGNTATSTGTFGQAKGGGIWGGGTITNSTISGNTATSTLGDAEGGGIGGGGGTTITNSTISGNTATTSGTSQGGGLYNISTTNVNNSTITENNAGTNGDGIFQASTLNLKNTIVAQNDSEDFFRQSGTLNSNGNNLIGNNQNVTTEFPAGSPNANGDYVGTSASPLDAMLGSLRGNFGDTANHALLAGSLAINNGDNTGAPTTDQRGFTRPQGGTVDIGAFEFSGITIVRKELPDGLTQINYSENTGAAGGTLPYTFSFTGTPPPGLMINSTTGKISGIPTMAGTYNFGVQVQDSTPFTGRNSKTSKTALAPNVAVQNYQIQVFAPTSAAVELRGKVLTSKGRGLSRALVVLTDAAGETKVYTTNPFGYFNFSELRSGETYILEAYRKGYEFQARIITMDDSISNFQITPVP